VVLFGVALAGPAAAQTFPAASAYVAFQCGGGPMVDAVGDTANATGALDLVGTAPFPTGLHAADAQFLYLRLRVAATPLGGGNMLQNAAWGFELDLDGDRSTYELLIAASGTNNTSQVAIYRHPATVVANDPADPAVLPASFSYPFNTHGRAGAADSSLGGTPDAFLDLAVPWADLATVGVQRNTPVYVWAGSSTVANALDLDLACFSGAGGQLGGIDVGRTTPDPNGGGGGTGGTGGGSGGTGPRTLEGGLGCSLAPRAPALPAMLLLALVVGALGARRYFRSSR
jgi:hypothetical protein